MVFFTAFWRGYKTSSAGFIVYEDKDIICLASNYADETERTPQQANGIITIPKCAVIEQKILTD